jgi:hypothetical protein
MVLQNYQMGDEPVSIYRENTYESSEVVALPLQGVAEPYIIVEVIHIKH